METRQLSKNCLKLAKNFRCLLIGNSESGKSTFLSSLIKHKEDVFQEPGYSTFILCSPNIGDPTFTAASDLQFQEQLQEWAKPAQILFFNKIISEEELFSHADATNGRLLLMVDDFSMEIMADPLVYKLFSRLSSHSSIDTCLSLHQGTKSGTGKFYPLVNENANFKVQFRNISNREAIGIMSRKMFPYGGNHLQKCLNIATDICGSFAYVCIDASLKNELNNEFGVRTNIFGENDLPMLLFKNPKSYDKRY